MAHVLQTCNFFLFLLFLCMLTHGNHGREIAEGAQQNIIIDLVHENDDKSNVHPCHNHVHHGCYHKEMIMMNHDIHQHMQDDHTSSSSSSHMDLSWNIFFHIDDLKAGKNIPLYFPIKNKSFTPKMISKQESESIPFSSTQLPKILEFFSFPQNSPQAKAIQHTLMHCELPPLKGETKFCATSLESMLDNLRLIFGLGNNFEVLSTTHMKNLIPNLQNYTILEVPKEISATKIIGCHPVAYPYAVYYCHGQVSDNRLFVMSLEGQDGQRVEAVAMCHMDTSQWDPHHVSFRVLRIEPGISPVCHIFPQDNLVWVSSHPSSIT